VSAPRIIGIAAAPEGWHVRIYDRANGKILTVGGNVSAHWYAVGAWGLTDDARVLPMIPSEGMTCLEPAPDECELYAPEESYQYRWFSPGEAPDCDATPVLTNGEETLWRTKNGAPW
jgi:hypothetical protein